MSPRGCLIAGFVFLWASVIVIPLGTHLLTQSPRFKEYEREYYESIVAANPGKDLGPNMFFMAFVWPFVAFCWFCIGWLFTVGGLMICNLVGWERLLVAGVFGTGCLAGAFLGIREAVEVFRWDFIVWGVGYLLFAAGLGFGAVGAVGSCFIKKPLWI